MDTATQPTPAEIKAARMMAGTIASLAETVDFMVSSAALSDDPDATLEVIRALALQIGFSADHTAKLLHGPCFRVDATEWLIPADGRLPRPDPAA
ncbi:MAG: hypothetical protein IPI03_02630 [Rubrivivax sp.]|jgi:hypothetical protein|nr:hypothetical protein [Rubrivivax sp.]MBK7260838.1 hypothetical protein [Rubrivivax sp.]MBK8527227.1 hypothetical protein [Rubrivivax sp.]